MRGLFHLAILAAAIYFGYTQLWPRIRSHQESGAAKQLQQPSHASAAECISAAESVTDDFAREIRQFPSPPIDPGLWSTFLIQTGSALSAADSLCRCPGDACLSAATALDEQRKLLNQFDALVRGTSTGVSNPATALERIESLLSRARSEAD